MALPSAIYQAHRPQDSDYYHCVEDYCETFMQKYDDRFSRQYGFWRPCVSISRTGASRWSDTTAITVTFHAEKEKRRE